MATIWLPVLARAGITADVHTLRTGWHPIGGGRIRASIQAAGGDERRIRPLSLVDRGALRGVHGRAVTANLPDHIARRMAARAEALLAERGIEAHIERACETAQCPGAGLFIAAEFEHGLGGACALGRRGKPAEQVASEAVESLLGYMDSGAAFDIHMGDQVLLPAAFARASFRFTVERATSHLTTNAWVIEQFGCARIDIYRRNTGTALVTVGAPLPSRRWGAGTPMTSAARVVEVLLHRQGRLYSEALGLDLCSGDSSVLFQWLCASFLLAAGESVQRPRSRLRRPC